MNFSKLRSKRILIPTVAAVAVLGAGGTVWATTTSDELGGSERDRVAAAATEAVGGGTAVDVETSDDRGEAYEVEVRMDDGTEVDVELDADLDVVRQETEDDSDDPDSGPDGGPDSDSDDRSLSEADRAAAQEAALAAVGGGTVVDVEAGDDGSQAFEVDVVDEDGTEWDVDLDADFGVLDKRHDD